VSLLIQDGFTLQGRIAAQGRLPEVNFSYRPAMPERVFSYQAAPEFTGPQRMTKVINLLVQHVVDWDVLDANGAPIVLSAEVLRRVPQRILLRMVDIVTGYSDEEAAVDVKN
jgi:hypothetical protein